METKTSSRQPRIAMARVQTCAVVFVGCMVLSGCHSLGHHHQTATALSYRDPQTGIRVERGRPNVVLDSIGSVAGIPTKLALWDRRADSHDVSPKTESALLRYMDRNELNGSLVRINQYDPWGEWKRLTSNKRISPAWRYTVGVYNGLEYTLLPGRIFGGDWYNPFTDTMHVYSDIAPLAISRAAYAKDIRTQTYPGTYAATQELPIVGMVHQTRATRDAMAYGDQFSSPADREEMHRILSPDYGSSWGGQLASFVPFGAPLGRLAGAVVGHATNRIQGGKASTPDIAPVASCDDPECY
ncbi:hypothetical protein SH528x_006983 [Novipirellula sp. SH528]|uniref:hypothetical protein n=1 Tax=Novipirellula sp. SH528 TaxID=3454466 RepID=UPI003F9F8BE2